MEELSLLLNSWIDEYCKRRNYKMFEVCYDRNLVFYYTGDDFLDYSSFNYLEVDLFN